MTNLTFSIVIPTFNAERFLAETLDSIEAQLDASYEVLVVDGGSTDRTQEIVEAANITTRWIDLPGRSQVAAINHGFSVCSGEVLCWLNADDLYTRGALRSVHRFLKRNPEVRFVYGDAVAIDAEGRFYGTRQHVRSANSEVLLREDPIVQPAAFWTREFFDEVGPLDESLDFVFDYDFFIRAANVATLCYLETDLVFERLHQEQKTAVGGARRLDELAKISQRYSGTNSPPESFAAEATTTWLLEAARSARGGQWGEARVSLAKIARPVGRPHQLAGRLAALCIGGEAGLIRASLIRNRLRGDLAHRRALLSRQSPPLKDPSRMSSSH